MDKCLYTSGIKFLICIFIITFNGCGHANFTKITHENMIGSWTSSFDISKLTDDMMVGILAGVKFKYTFEENKVGSRNAVAMGIETNSKIDWKIDDNGHLIVSWKPDEEEKTERYEYVSPGKIRLIKEDEEVVTYLIKN